MSPLAKERASVLSINPYQVWHCGPIFSQVASTVGPVRVVATAGQVGVDAQGVLIKDPEAQIEQAFKNLRRCLEAAGARVQDVFKMVWYIVNYDHKNRLYRKSLIEFLGGHRPATTACAVLALAEPDYVFEVEAYAAVPQSPVQSVDVVVVGAGLSGLKAAYEVQKAGYSCLVVEARDRVGGKTYSVDPLGENKYVDLGAAWINDTNQSHIYALAMSLGLDMIVQNTTGHVIQEDIGGQLSSYAYGDVPKELAEPHSVEDMIAIRDLTEKICQSIDLYHPVATGEDLDKYTLEDWVKQKGLGKTALASVTIWTRVMLGLEPSDMSALYFMDYCRSGGGLLRMRSDKNDGGQYLRLVRGTQSISEELSKLLSHEEILVSAGRGDIRCKRVIVSIPTPLYKEIKFSPSLPPAKQELSHFNKLGYQMKVMLLYAKPWWRAHNLCGMLQSFKGPVCVTRDSSVEEKGQYSLTCFVSGQKGIELSTGTKQARHAAVLSQIKKVYSPFVHGPIPEPLEIAEHEWANDQWAQGCPCPVSPPGVMTKYGHALRTPYGKVHFVGTETAFECKGYMDGAVRSGERGAAEVIHMLSRAGI
ncbi:hypothetical protein H2200_006745 [Cladophialophora chaetospira]|uniref:Amine oxidase n=1 Tax=Cladophialophora chaetospira TaxID=386627 RepID=A0AA38X8Z0_9EURO|nr:hypothetical protein H2200_006745 [Cladophialophora chaetospira]